MLIKKIVVSLLICFISFNTISAEKKIVKKSSTKTTRKIAEKQWLPEPFPESVENLPSGYLGLNPRKFYELFNKKTTSITKDEFETSEEFVKRTSDKNQILSPLTISDNYAFKIESFKDFYRLQYDADLAIFTTGQFGYSCGPSHSMEKNNNYEICSVAPITEHEDVYIGSNAYGATREVNSSNILELALAIPKDSLLLKKYEKAAPDGFQDRISVPLDKARTLSDKEIGVLFVGKLLDIQSIRGHTTHIKPTIDDPREIRVNRTAIPFDLKKIIYYVVETGEILEQRQ